MVPAPGVDRFAVGTVVAAVVAAVALIPIPYLALPLPITRHDFHGDWNYTLTPTNPP
jgi:hypothetical protein